MTEWLAQQTLLVSQDDFDKWNIIEIRSFGETTELVSHASGWTGASKKLQRKKMSKFPNLRFKRSTDKTSSINQNDESHRSHQSVAGNWGQGYKNKKSSLLSIEQPSSQHSNTSSEMDRKKKSLSLVLADLKVRRERSSSTFCTADSNKKQHGYDKTATDSNTSTAQITTTKITVITPFDSPMEEDGSAESRDKGKNIKIQHSAATNDDLANSDNNKDASKNVRGSPDEQQKKHEEEKEKDEDDDDDEVNSTTPSEASSSATPLSAASTEGTDEFDDVARTLSQQSSTSRDSNSTGASFVMLDPSPKREGMRNAKRRYQLHRQHSPNRRSNPFADQRLTGGGENLKQLLSAIGHGYSVETIGTSAASPCNSNERPPHKPGKNSDGSYNDANDNCKSVAVVYRGDVVELIDTEIPTAALMVLEPKKRRKSRRHHRHNQKDKTKMTDKTVSQKKLDVLLEEEEDEASVNTVKNSVGMSIQSFAVECKLSPRSAAKKVKEDLDRFGLFSVPSFKARRRTVKESDPDCVLKNNEKADLVYIDKSKSFDNRKSKHGGRKRMEKVEVACIAKSKSFDVRKSTHGGRKSVDKEDLDFILKCKSFDARKINRGSRKNDDKTDTALIVASKSFDARKLRRFHAENVGEMDRANIMASKSFDVRKTNRGGRIFGSPSRKGVAPSNEFTRTPPSILSDSDGDDEEEDGADGNNKQENKLTAPKLPDKRIFPDESDSMSIASIQETSTKDGSNVATTDKGFSMFACFDQFQTKMQCVAATATVETKTASSI
ncbi:hypothetical protein ACA910_012558 [Epithemia clementina (nom. ined.)]